MKKLMIVVVVILIIIMGHKPNSSFSLLDYFSGEYTVYTENASGEDGTDLGFCYMNSKPQTPNVVGESIVIENLELSNAIETLKARVIKTEFLDDGTTVIYAYTNLISKFVKLENQKTNLQIAIRNEKTVIGWPLIIGSF